MLRRESAAASHKGAAVCEILQHCVIFNDNAYDNVYKKEGRAKNSIYLQHGKPMLFGENNEYGLMQEGFGLKVVKLGENLVNSGKLSGAAMSRTLEALKRYFK